MLRALRRGREHTGHVNFMTSCIIALFFIGLFCGATIVLPILGAIAQANEPKVPSVIDPGFPARSFEAKAREVISRLTK